MTRSKTKKPRKQKPKTTKHVPDQLPKPEIKVSEAVLKLSEPLRQKYRDSHRTQVIISITVMAWNISLFPKEEQVQVQEILIKALPEKLGAEDVSLFLEEIDTLIERKNLDYPNIRAHILNYQLSSSGNTISLTVSTTPVPESI
jgi:hypothetical protein